ncbi:protein phosphatase 1 regulatory subunit 12A isoform X3 [Eurosta solidaginis]|uniref:protein phosphatase 1 regulatory subunit 12A isoform X3 n=1 Tax=Eurosta solidaginis TaxID=178769 RepID=UPI0035312371
MTSLDVRNNSAVMKRAEQLKRWEESDTNRQPPTPRPERGRKIKFSSGCVFLAACMSGDKEEVLKLLENGADINTANVDGLTALHQACIDDNLEMVEFLIEHGADINKQDNEGWTPLHATASCGFVSIARYLVEHGADPATVNSDGDLAVDLAVDIQHLPMMDFMQKVMTEHNIDCEKARQAEEQLMLSDAKKWLRSDASEVDRPHPKTGATALHVAAAKGYTKVISLLLAGRANVDKQDNDGWTPLHASAHWGQKEAAEMLVNAMADMDVRNYAGQTCIDVADRKMAKFLEELRSTSNKRVKRRPSSQIRISDKIENHIDNTPTKIIRVEVKSDQSKDQANAAISDNELPIIDSRSEQLDVHNLSRITEYDETDSELTDSTESSHSTSLSDPEDEKSKQSDTIKSSSNITTSSDNQTGDDEAPWRRNSLARVRTQNDSPTKNQVPDKDVSKTNSSTTDTSDVILRRTQSFEHDEKFYQKYHELRARIKANSCPILPATQIQNINNSSSNSNSRNNNSNSSNSSNSNNNINNNSAIANSQQSNINQNNSNNKCNKTITNIINNHPTSALGVNVYTNIPNYSVQRSASLKDHRNYRTISTNTSATTIPASYNAPSTGDSSASTTTSAITTNTSSTAATTTTPIRSSTPKLSANVEKAANADVASTTNNNNNKIGNTVLNLNTANNSNNNNNNDTKQSSSSSSSVSGPSTPDASASTTPTTTTTKPKMSAGTIFKNFFKSFVPPVRDEESETQRKAHAKRVRETRRSTQGVTLDEIKSAEELVKKKNSNMNNNNNGSSNETQIATVTTTTISTAKQQQQENAESTKSHTESQERCQSIHNEATITLQTRINSAELKDVAESDQVPVDDDGENVSATFTIVAPARKVMSPAIDDATTDDTTDDNDDDEKIVSATYTLTPRHSYVGSVSPTEVVETTIVVTPPEIRIEDESDVNNKEDVQTVKKKGDEQVDRNDDESSESEEERENESDSESEDDEESKVSNKLKQTEAVANETTKTARTENVAKSEIKIDNEDEDDNESDDEEEEEECSEESELIETNELPKEKTEDARASPKLTIDNENNATVNSASNTYLPKIDTHTTSNNDRARLTPLPLAVNESVPANDRTTPTTPISTVAKTPTPTLESPVRLREKRIPPPYESDNSSSNTSTLVERLRYEASKYSSVQGAGGDELTVASKTRSLPPTSLLHESDSLSGGGVITYKDSTSYGKIMNSSRRSLDATSLPLASECKESSPLHLTNELQVTNKTTNSSINSYSSGALTTTTTHSSSGSSSSSGALSSSSNTMAERRPSWRLKFDAGCKFKLEDASSGNTFPSNNSTIIPSAPAVIAAANLSSTISQRRINSNSLNSSNQSLNSVGRPVSAPVNASTSTTALHSDGDGVSIFSRRLTAGGYSSSSSIATTTPTATATTSATATTTTATGTSAASVASASKANDDKDNDKENDNRNLAAQSAIQRRRKPKRRSTGVVHLDMDELDPERQDSANDAEDKEKEKEKESGSEQRAASRSRLNSTTTGNSATDENKSRDNGEPIDYKALWEAVKLENEKLKHQLKKKDEEVVQTKATLERITNAQLEVFKTENQRLKEENGALIRVISKLSK